MTRRALSIALLVAGLLAAPARPQSDEDATRSPRESTLVEKAAARIVQLDVTLTGPEEQLEDITADDLRVKIGTKVIEEFQLDRLCRDPEPGREVTITREDGVEDTLPAPRLAPVTYMFYFDQRHLTVLGRQEGLETVRQLIPQLIRDGNRGLLLSNGRELATFTDLTNDPDELLAGLDRMMNDPDQWDPFATQESMNLDRIEEELSHGRYSEAVSLARKFYREELWQAEQDLRRFQMALTRFAEVEVPKAVIYLADTMRSDAGQHYLDLFGEMGRQPIPDDSGIEAPEQDFADAAQGPFNQVIDEASAHGIRLYTVEAQGLAPPSRRVRSAQSTLAGFSLETGGRAFLNGVRPAKMVETIEADFACLYLVSFEPEGLPLDSPLKVSVQVDRKKVRAQVRGRIVIQGESAALTSRLLAAYTAPTSRRGSIPVQATLVPTGFVDGKFNALVQVSVPGTQQPASISWDLGASVVTSGNVKQTSRRLTVATPGASAVLQEPMVFAPGPYELIAVAHNINSDEVASAQLDGEWPKPNAENAAVGPIAVLQPMRAAISKSDEVTGQGAVAFAEKEPVRVDRPTAVVALVCKAGDVRGALVVERELVGSGDGVDFPRTTMDLGKERCGLIQDIIPAGTMTPGAFRYRIRVLDDSHDELALGQRKFYAWDGATEDGGEDASVSSAAAPAGGS